MMNNNIKKAPGVSFGNDEGGVVSDANLKQVMGKVYFGMGNIYLSLAVMGAMKTHTDKQLELVRGIADEMGNILKDFEGRDAPQSCSSIDVAKMQSLERAVRQLGDADKMSAVIRIIHGVFESASYVIGLFEMNDLSERMDNLESRINNIEHDSTLSQPGC